MILYKAIKYKILEYCLDSVCNSIKRNFTKFGATIKLEDLRNGMRVSRICFDGYDYIDCLIEFCSGIGKLQNGQELYVLSIVCKKTTAPDSHAFAIIERTKHYLFELKMCDEECTIFS